MIRVAGIDVSSRSVDIVRLPLDAEHDATEIRYERIEIQGAEALSRAIDATGEIPRGTYWDETAVVYIERPFGANVHSVLVSHLVIGAILACLPAELRKTVKLISPQSWRKRSGLGTKASKQEVRSGVIARVPGISQSLEQDAYDAVGVAMAARADLLGGEASSRGAPARRAALSSPEART